MNIRTVALWCKVNVLQPDSFLQLVRKVRVLEKFSAVGTVFVSMTVSGGQREIAGATGFGPLGAAISTAVVTNPGYASLHDASLQHPTPVTPPQCPVQNPQMLPSGY